ncbi:CDGSH iron-sulfur domain-containing protein [Kribbella sp.]|uniref:CDGSH iron-sulfur domain-containing protein n=1 Tax=Kribbella sp. TaxID=1871183 RepID=UPI002D5A7D75|nr:CDGSH iron-sulfur domain-containing protein [Kribbella sp.]HZX02839.1 CDGSH iron-sulfur domain-containing protein [Kribbella sp.]
MTEIRAYPDGPLLVRGEFELLDEHGDPVPSSRRTIALCRCGRSAIPPLCDGTHTLPVSRPSAHSRE